MLVKVSSSAILLPLFLVFLCNVQRISAGKKKDGLVIVLSNGGCGGNIVVSTGKEGKKGGGGHKILVKGGGQGGCGCNHNHEESHEVMPIPMPMGDLGSMGHGPMGHGPMSHGPMGAHSQLVPSFSNENMDTSSSDHVTSPSDLSEHDDSKENENSSKSSSSSGSPDTSKKPAEGVVAPLFVPSHIVPPPWWTHGSPVFVDPASSGHSNQAHTEKTSASSNHPQHAVPMQQPAGMAVQNQLSQPRPGEIPFAMMNFEPVNGKEYPPQYQPVQEAFRGVWPEEQLMSHSSHVPQMMPPVESPNHNMPAYDWNGFVIPLQPSYANQIANATSGNIPFASPSPGPAKRPEKAREGPRMPGINYIQPILSSVQKLIKNSRPSISLASLEGIREQGQRMMASYSQIIPVVTNYTARYQNYTAHLPSLPTLPILPNNLGRANMSAIWQMVDRNNGNSNRHNHNHNPNGSNRGKDNGLSARYLESLRSRIRPVSIGVESLRMAPLLDTILRNVRRVTSPSSRGRNRRRGGKPGGRRSLANDPVMQQYLEQILSSKWWEWPSGGLLGASLNHY